MTSFSFFKHFDAFELDVNAVNFVYYGKTLMKLTLAISVVKPLSQKVCRLLTGWFTCIKIIVIIFAY